MERAYNGGGGGGNILYGYALSTAGVRKGRVWGVRRGVAKTRE